MKNVIATTAEYPVEAPSPYTIVKIMYHQKNRFLIHIAKL